MEQMEQKTRDYVYSFLAKESGVSPKAIKEHKDMGLVAVYDQDTDTIFIKDLKKIPTIDELFAIAHEWRHVWQSKIHPEDLNDYRERAECQDLEDYNNQPAEIDANAWAWIVVSKMLGGKGRPTFPSLSRETVAKIEERKKELETEE